MGSKNVSALFLLLVVITVGYSQQPPRLILLKGNHQITQYKEGDLIRFKRKDRDHFNRGIIAGLTQDYFRIQDDTTYLTHIEKIDLTGGEKSGSKSKIIGGTLILAGGLLFFGDMINETVVNDNSYSINAGVITVSALLIGTGVLLSVTNTEMYTIGRRKRLLVLTN